jgi:uncharacterized membrane protein YhhN
LNQSRSKMKRLSYILLIFFIADFIIDALLANRGDESLRYISKGLITVLLLAFFINEVRSFITKAASKYITLVCCALIFSFLGDVFLVHNSSLNFMLGLASFLIAHIFYILFFYRIHSFKNKSRHLFWISSIIILSYVVILNCLFNSNVTAQGLTIPVLLYSFVLGTMAFAAINVNNVSKRAANFTFCITAGAIIFVASDSMLAFNKFYLAKPLPGFYIMLTYCIAQFFIVMGAVKFIKQY